MTLHITVEKKHLFCCIY